MVKTKAELIESIQSADMPDDVKISLLEDVTDSMETDPVDMSQYVSLADYEKAVSDYEEMKTRYIERFSERVEDSSNKDDLEDDRVIIKEEI